MTFLDKLHIEWRADDKFKNILVKLVNKVEENYNEQRLTLASLDIEEAQQSIITLIEEDKKLTRLDELQCIARSNYCDSMGTYDYDGIAETVFERIDELKKEIK